MVVGLSGLKCFYLVAGFSDGVREIGLFRTVSPIDLGAQDSTSQRAKGLIWRVSSTLTAVGQFKRVRFELKCLVIADVGATTSRTSGGNALEIDEWTHVAAAWDADDPVMRQYKNGQEIDSVNKAGNAVATGPGVKIGIGNQSIARRGL